MADQTVIQVRVDNELKEQVAEIYDRIGIDIPTAVRMFFKATVREDDLPFTTKGKTAEQKEPTQAEKLMEYVKGIMMYEPPLASDENTIVVLPLENGYEIPTAMYAQLVDIVPANCRATSPPRSSLRHGCIVHGYIGVRRYALYGVRRRVFPRGNTDYDCR